MGTEREEFQHDPNFNGPIKNRSCTDIICLILFLLCFILFIGVGVWAFLLGRPETLLYPIDSQGRFCGNPQDPTVKDKKYLVFFDITACIRKTGIANLAPFSCDTPQVCVDQCPSGFYFVGWPDANISTTICMYNTSLDKSKWYDMNYRLSLTSGLSPRCAVYYFPSTPIVNRCIPTFLFDWLGKLNDTSMDINNATGIGNLKVPTFGDLKHFVDQSGIWLEALGFGEKALRDLNNSWYWLLILLLIAMIWGAIWICLMRCVSKLMVWLSLIAFVGIFVFLTIWCGLRYLDLRNNPNTPQQYYFTTNFGYYFQIANTWLVLAIISGVLLLILLLVLIFLRTRICIAIEIVNQTSKAIGHMLSALFWPLFPFLLKLALIAYYLAAVINIASIRNAQIVHGNGSSAADVISDIADATACSAPNKTSQLETVCRLFKYGPAEYTIYVHLGMLFLFLWILNFIVALSEIVLAGAFASYYFALHKPQDIPALPVLASFWRAFRYHLGSIAFGALLIAIVQMIRVILEYIDQKVQKSDNSVAKFIMCCCKCCFWCLEKCLRFLNRNAYIMIAIYGKNFCVSAKDGFFLIFRNAVRTFVVDKVADYLLFIATLVIVGGVTALAYFFFSGDLERYVYFLHQPSLNYVAIPVTVVAVGSFFIASLFLSVFAMGVDTIFLCFLQDLEMNDGSPEKPFYMSKELMRILDKRNRAPGENTKRCC